MTHLDLYALLRELDPDDQGGRRPIDDIATAVHKLASHVQAHEVPDLVVEVIERGEREGLWSIAKQSVRRGSHILPKAITLIHEGGPVDRQLTVDVPLRSELASWAATLRLSSSQRSLLLAVNDWLKRTNGGDVPIVAAAERAYELTNDEKAFDSTPRGGATLWGPGRLTFDLLRCERVPTPLTWEPVASHVGSAGPVVCVENHATFRTLLRLLRESNQPPWTAVAWVQGRNTAPLESLTRLPFPVTRLDYLGDLDPAGLEIAATACATARSVDVPAGPATLLWEQLVEKPPRKGVRIDEARAHQLANWLPATVRRRAITLLTNGQAIPQEALRYDVLAETLRVTTS